MRTENARLRLFKILAFYIILLAVWFVREMFLRPVMIASFDSWGFEFCETAIKIVVWTVPAVLLVRRYKDDVLLSWKEMLTSKFKWYKYALILLGFVAYNLIGAFAVNGNISISSEFQLSSLVGSVMFVGVTEEVVFRGFFLNALLKKMKTWSAVLLTALMFLLVHFPIWIYEGMLLSNMLSGGFIAVAALSVIFSWVFIKSKNIIVPIVLHMAWNLLIELLF